MDTRPWRGWYSLAAWRGPKGRRRAQLAAEPLCRICLSEGRVTAADTVDHVIPHRGDPDLFWTGELQSLCKMHHDAWKQGVEARGYSGASDEDGWPSDPNHPANLR